MNPETVMADPGPVASSIDTVARVLRWARLRLVLRAEEALHLPPYKGSTFRGAFGHAFKHVACPLRRGCDGCAHKAVCVYAYVFNTEGTGAGSALARGRTVAHPFVLEPPDTAAREIPAGAELALGLILIGRAIALAPYFLAGCREMGRRGVGKGRKRFRVERAVADDPETTAGRVVYDGAADLLAPAVPVWSVAEFMQGSRAAEGQVPDHGPWTMDHRGAGSGQPAARSRAEPMAHRAWREPTPGPVAMRLAPSALREEERGDGREQHPQPWEEYVTLEFLTPTRLRQDADLVVKPEFATLATALLRRLSVLAEVHCGARIALDAKAILETARDVRVERSELRWHDWERYSARQDARMALGGFLGRITFAGPLAPWWPLLQLGEVLHVGKGTAFGLGRYRMEKPWPCP